MISQVWTIYRDYEAHFYPICYSKYLSRAEDINNTNVVFCNLKSTELTTVAKRSINCTPSLLELLKFLRLSEKIKTN